MLDKRFNRAYGLFIGDGGDALARAVGIFAILQAQSQAPCGDPMEEAFCIIARNTRQEVTRAFREFEVTYS